ncbi:MULTISPECIES: bifunctional methylenetetrahydrofolate dehydrogenase/methenyltetrahydrofolate cyclohydrolase FolD [Helicobacter]|uniref:bifunctional methylenetetrahydrofolate dehydrogenase/methenyltetrahydrofolate cyclohydrolase FolD n=1 Tax=Helicobacter TaxID=209 RepID=UPI000DCC98BC|nr:MULTISPECIES: bifunctional methylenetetrahydrofolate dehydrogenase/methenyltetrahydrofolate cyclohydrolase FolD [Helicobacter]MCI2235269.1 bifunctional methylenetetrahydrofolate dehydrogenase/methenyltetrahydrofolate cyclohydrolase FolD [Helicobacter sp. CaF467b]MCI7766200.1 bifunctional methylenetetrahydrofolate dehydrogenase/methenyltetrahydrofolate cyclohydrolase FolD [Helicobacter sp.]MCL9821603.1 bifunctional methylenetetrahydrofolate dehydrogenase/methenyltetrahydrofolate cyclohydrolase
MQILDGKALALEIQQTIKQEVQELSKQQITPGLAVILVGDDPASQSYVNMKAKACSQTGIYSTTHKMPESITEEALLQTISMMNENPNIDGILVQLPLPKHINTTAILEAISPKKDVDGFHPFNMGRVFTNLDGFIPATPMGVITLLEHYKIPIEGKNVVIVGASNIVGKPLGALFLNKNATITLCHIYTQNLANHTKNADIICVGVGKPNLITQDMVKEGAIVVDIGITRLENGKIVGDVDYDNVAPKCSYITPVPGGVGPMTIASLLQNTIKAAKLRAKKETK